jgi:hypothetical protein
LVLFFRHIGIFVEIIGLELHENTAEHANDFISTHHLDDHIHVYHLDVMTVQDSYVKSKKIDIIYTTATADFYFFWKILKLALASERVQVTIIPTCELQKMKTVNGSQLHFISKHKYKSGILKFCKANIATNENSNMDGESRDLSIMKMETLRDENTSDVISDILEFAVQYHIEDCLKCFLAHNNNESIRRIIEKLPTDPIEITSAISISLPSIISFECTGGIKYKCKIKSVILRKWKSNFLADKNESYALSHIRKLIKELMVTKNIFMTTWRRVVTCSRDPVAHNAKDNIYSSEMIEYIRTLFIQHDHVKFESANKSHWQNIIKAGADGSTVNEQEEDGEEKQEERDEEGNFDGEEKQEERDEEGNQEIGRGVSGGASEQKEDGEEKQEERKEEEHKEEEEEEEEEEKFEALTHKRRREENE